MIQNARISSQTIAPGSATAMWRAVSVQAHQPTSALAPSSMAHCGGLR